MKLLMICFFCFTFISCKQHIDDRILKDYTREELEYFYEIALSLEYEQKSSYNLCFWTRDVRIKLNGEFTAGDSLEAVHIIDELNTLINTVDIKLVDKRENLEVFLLKERILSNIAVMPQLTPDIFLFIGIDFSLKVLF